MVHNNSAADQEKLEIDSNLESIINNIFESTFTNPKDLKIIAGVAIESRRLDIVEKVIQKSPNVSELLNFIFDISQKNIQSKKFKDELIQLILESYSKREQQNVSLDAWNICSCYFHLNKYHETALVLSKLVNGNEDDFLLACQISSDITEAENQNFSENLITQFSNTLTETETASGQKAQLISILSGEFNERNSFKFLSQNNRSNKDIISTMKKFWDNKNMIYHNGIVNCYALMHSGTADDTYLNEPLNKEWLSKNSHWSKFTSIA